MKKFLVMFIQIAITATVGWALISRIDLAGTWKQVLNLAPSWGTAAFLVIVIQIFVTAFRLKLIVAALEHRSSFWACLRACFAGGFVGQTPLSVFGGDMARIWCITGPQMPLRIAASAVAIDRTLGTVALLTVIGALIVPLWLYIPDPALRSGLIAMIVISLCSLAGLLSLRFMPGWSRRSRLMHWLWQTAIALGRLLARSHRGIVILGVGVVVHLTSVIALYAIARGLGATVGLFDCLVLAPVPLFLSFLPISFGGWGVREAVLVTAFGLIGMPAHVTLAVSILFGVALMVASLPGAFVLVERSLLLKPAPVSGEPI